MRDRRDLDGGLGEVDAVGGEPVDDGPEGRAQRRVRAMLEAEIDAAVRRAAPGFDFLQDGVAAGVACDDVFAVLGDAVGLGELFAAIVEQPAAQLVAERVPHDRVHADQPRRQVADREELHELHVDQRRAGAQRQRVAVAAHVRRRAVAAIEPRQAAGGDDGGLGVDDDRLAGAEMQRHGADDVAAVAQQIDDAQVAGAADARDLVHHRAHCLRHGRAGVEEIDIDAARPVVARRHRLRDAAVLAGPADAPFVQSADAVGAFLAQQARQVGVAQAAAGLERVVVVVTPMIGRLGAERDGDRHLRHHGGAAAADQAAVGEQHVAAAARRLDRGVHAGGAGADHQDVRFRTHRFGSHATSATNTRTHAVD